jgi:cytochrome b561
MAGGFPLIVEMILSGFLFWFIMVLVLVMGALGYLMENDDYDSDVDLQARAIK